MTSPRSGATPGLGILALTGIPLVRPGDDLAGLIGEALLRLNLPLAAGDVVVVAQKVVSKSEGQLVRLRDVRPSPTAEQLATDTGKDPRLVELILRESTHIVRKAPGVIIVKHRLGVVCANAGIDQSNVEHSDGECALLLPQDPDGSARRLREALMQAAVTPLGVVISDSANRPWRLGTVGIALGSAGITVLDDRRGDTDLFGRQLNVTVSNRADSIATAAMLIMGETSERVPAVLVRGLPSENSTQTARDALRPAAKDLFL